MNNASPFHRSVSAGVAAALGALLLLVSPVAHADDDCGNDGRPGSFRTHFHNQIRDTGWGN